MTAHPRLPLQDVVSVICDALTDLPAHDQERALEAARVILGLNAPVARSTHPKAEAEPELVEPTARPWEPSLFQEPPRRRVLPTVEVQMMGDRPMVVGQQASRGRRQQFGRSGARVVIGPQPQRDSPRQLPAPRVEEEILSEAETPSKSPPSRRGYVFSIR